MDDAFIFLPKTRDSALYTLHLSKYWIENEHGFVTASPPKYWTNSTLGDQLKNYIVELIKPRTFVIQRGTPTNVESWLKEFDSIGIKVDSMERNFEKVIFAIKKSNYERKRKREIESMPLFYE